MNAPGCTPGCKRKTDSGVKLAAIPGTRHSYTMCHYSKRGYPITRVASVVELKVY